MEFERIRRLLGHESPRATCRHIVLTPIKENATRVAALLSGDVDFIAPVPPDRPGPDQRRRRTSNWSPCRGTRIIIFQMNQKRVEAFKDPRVRQAIAYAINQEGIAAKIMKGFATAGGAALAGGLCRP